MFYPVFKTYFSYTLFVVYLKFEFSWASCFKEPASLSADARRRVTCPLGPLMSLRLHTAGFGQRLHSLPGKRHEMLMVPLGDGCGGASLRLTLALSASGHRHTSAFTSVNL